MSRLGGYADMQIYSICMCKNSCLKKNKRAKGKKERPFLFASKPCTFVSSHVQGEKFVMHNLFKWINRWFSSISYQNSKVWGILAHWLQIFRSFLHDTCIWPLSCLKVYTFTFIQVPVYKMCLHNLLFVLLVHHL